MSSNIPLMSLPVSIPVLLEKRHLVSLLLKMLSGIKFVQRVEDEATALMTSEKYVVLIYSMYLYFQQQECD